jgi:hypothetical protein
MSESIVIIVFPFAIFKPSNKALCCPIFFFKSIKTFLCHIFRIKPDNITSAVVSSNIAIQILQVGN